MSPSNPSALAETTLVDLATLPVHEAVHRLEEVTLALGACEQPEVLTALAATLPRRLDGLAPEVALALAALAERLAAHQVRWPEDLLTATSLPPRCQVAWLRAALHDRATASDQLDDERLLSLTTGWQLGSLPDAAPLLERMAAARDPRLRLAALRAAPAALAQLAVSVAQVRSLALTLAASDPSVEVRCAALALAGAGYLGAPRTTLEEPIESALRSGEAALVEQAITLAAALGMREELVALLHQADASSTTALAIEALGPLADEPTLTLVLTLAHEEPLLLGPPTRRLLLEAHRHGAFLRAHHLPAVLALYDDDPQWQAEEFLRVTYLVRKELMSLLAELPVHDLRWLRRAELLAASYGTEAPRLLEALLAQAAQPEVDARIAAALVRAAGENTELFDEAGLLLHLERVPELVIPALRAKGGERARTRLRELLLDPFCAPAVKPAALDALWALEPDRPSLASALATALAPSELEPLTTRALTAREDQAARALWQADPSQLGDAAARLRALCEAGQSWALPEVERLFREVLAGYVRAALAGDFTIKRVMLPELEQQVYRYGRALLKDGRPVRRWTSSSPETGRDLVLRFITEHLAEKPPAPIQVALLEMAARHQPEGATARRLELAWRKGDREVRRAALELLAAVPGAAQGQELSLGRLLTATEEPRLLTHALEVVASLRAAWAEPAVRAALEHREMAVKKAAAEALAELASDRSIPALLRWLTVHDNEGFRAPLLRALERAAGPSLIAIVVDKLEPLSDEPRARQLLHRVLHQRLPLAAVLKLARSASAVHQEVVTACLEGHLQVSDATPQRVASALHRARLRPPTSSRDPWHRLRTEGFSPELARDAVRELRTTAQRERGPLLELVRGQLASWLTYLRDAADPEAGALELVLQAAAPGELAPRALELAERWHPRVAPETILDFLERAWSQRGAAERLRAATLVRALPPSAKVGGLRRYRLLGRLGAVRTSAEVLAAVEECRLRPDFAGESFELLCEVLGIPPRRDREEPALSALREQAANAFRKSEAERRAWLTEKLRERPLELPLPEPVTPAPPRDARPSRALLHELLGALQHPSPRERSRAAERLLAWPQAHEARAQVEQAYFAGRVELSGPAIAALAKTLSSWPPLDEAAPRTRAASVVCWLPRWRRVELAPGWLAQWQAGQWHLGELLVALGLDVLLPLVVEHVRAGQPAAASLVPPGHSPPHQALAALLTEHGHRELAARIYQPTPEKREDQPELDPIAGKDAAQLEELLRTKGLAQGLAVRAVHALAQLGEGAVAPLSRLALDRRPAVRSAALRALRAVASREHTLEVTARVLEQETRRDVATQLLASLGHARHPPALPLLLDRVLDRDPKIQRAAEDALRAWGSDALPAIRRAVKHARPDKRGRYLALLEALA